MKKFILALCVGIFSALAIVSAIMALVTLGTLVIMGGPKVMLGIVFVSFVCLGTYIAMLEDEKREKVNGKK
jgi:hypothetical protein